MAVSRPKQTIARPFELDRNQNILNSYEYELLDRGNMFTWNSITITVSEYIEKQFHSVFSCNTRATIRIMNKSK